MVMAVDFFRIKQVFKFYAGFGSDFLVFNTLEWFQLVQVDNLTYLMPYRCITITVLNGHDNTGTARATAHVLTLTFDLAVSITSAVGSIFRWLTPVLQFPLPVRGIVILEQYTNTIYGLNLIWVDVMNNLYGIFFLKGHTYIIF